MRNYKERKIQGVPSKSDVNDIHKEMDHYIASFRRIFFLYNSSPCFHDIFTYVEKINADNDKRFV